MLLTKRIKRKNCYRLLRLVIILDIEHFWYTTGICSIRSYCIHQWHLKRRNTGRNHPKARLFIIREWRISVKSSNPRWTDCRTISEWFGPLWPVIRRPFGWRRWGGRMDYTWKCCYTQVSCFRSATSRWGRTEESAKERKGDFTTGTRTYCCGLYDGRFCNAKRSYAYGTSLGWRWRETNRSSEDVGFTLSWLLQVSPADFLLYVMLKDSSEFAKIQVKSSVLRVVVPPCYERR